MGVAEILVGISIIAIALPVAFFILVIVIELFSVIVVFLLLGLATMAQRLDSNNKKKPKP